MNKTAFLNILENVFPPTVNQALNDWFLKGAQSATEVTLTSETTYEVPFNSDNRFAKLTLGAQAITALTADLGDLNDGDEVLLRITQDSSAARAVSFSTGFAGAGGTDPVVTASTSAVDLFKGVVSDGEIVLVIVAQDIATLTA